MNGRLRTQMMRAVVCVLLLGIVGSRPADQAVEVTSRGRLSAKSPGSVHIIGADRAVSYIQWNIARSVGAPEIRAPERVNTTLSDDAIEDRRPYSERARTTAVSSNQHGRKHALAEHLSLSSPHSLRNHLGCSEVACVNNTNTIGVGTNTASFVDEGSRQKTFQSHFAPLSGIMASSAAMLSGLPSWQSSDNSDPTRDAFVEPSSKFVYMDSGNALVLELHIPGTTLQTLHKTEHGSLAEFLLKLHGELVAAANIDERRISILAIHERYQRMQPSTSFPASATKVKIEEPRIGDEVLVKFEVASPAGLVGDTLQPGDVMEVLRNQLKEESSTLRRGELGSLLKDATISLSLSPGLASVPLSKRKAVAQMSAMALPIGISAAFTGILIWLAAW